MEYTATISSQLAEDTVKGLNSNPKFLSSKYLYDRKGSEIFQKIMQMPEYYLTQIEYDIFKHQSHDIIKELTTEGNPIEVIELGAGDGLKTKLLFNELYRQKIDFRYVPIDISEDILLQMTSSFQKEFNDLEIVPKAGDYFDMMEEIELLSEIPKVILFLGSNIGNLSYNASVNFFKSIRNIIRSKDKLIIGFDTKKDPSTILNAYNDPTGHTRDFNLNMLKRLNNELGANFDLEQFEHFPLYDPVQGVAKSYIISKKDQSVFFTELNKTFHFKAWEEIYTEQSQKFDSEMIYNLAEASGFDVSRNFIDNRNYFIDSIWKPKTQ